MNGYGCLYLYLSVIRTFLKFFLKALFSGASPVRLLRANLSAQLKELDHFSFKTRHFCACLYSTMPVSSLQCSQGTVGLVQLSPYSLQLGLEFQVLSFQLTGLTAEQLFQSFLSLWWVFGGKSEKMSGWYYWQKKKLIKRMKLLKRKHY